MKNLNRKIILLPHIKRQYERKAFQALESKDYGRALKYLDQLIEHGEMSDEIIVGKIISLIELGNYKIANKLCQEMLKQSNEHYEMYLHIYCSMLFQTEQYDLLMKEIDQVIVEKGALSPFLEKALKDMYIIAEQIHEKERHITYVEHFDQFITAIAENNITKQWKLLEQMKRSDMQIEPIFSDYLKDPSIHPLIKTAIFQWFMDQKINEEITILKFERSFSCKPASTPPLKKQTCYLKIIRLLEPYEQKNPTFYHMMEKLLFRYLYVLFPIMPKEDHTPFIKEALVKICSNESALHMDHLPKEISQYIREITYCDQLYMEILDD